MKYDVPFEPTWESLTTYTCPEWFRDAKFGVWAHWGPQSVPRIGDWYARNLYLEDHPQGIHHRRVYGHPSKVGWKDMVKLWKAENFNPEALIEKYKSCGAKYFSACAAHSDNFDCWNSKHHAWNSVKVGPKKDIVGLWAKATRAAGLRFGVTEHNGRSYSWFNTNKGADKTGPYAGVPYDGSDPEYVDFYSPPHDDTSCNYPLNPSEEFKESWRKRTMDLIDQYDPDLLYTDGGVPFGEIGREVILPRI
ncbi:MAG: alpha-L-fucosidase [Phycisphaerae bacterium]|nr:alpha-L-fucosidase [Phycisphaerae bacterium]